MALSDIGLKKQIKSFLGLNGPSKVYTEDDYDR